MTLLNKLWALWSNDIEVLPRRFLSPRRLDCNGNLLDFKIICSRARKNRLIEEESGRQKDKLGWPPQNFDGRDLGQSSKAAIVSAFLCRWMLIGLPQGGTVYGRI